MSRKSDKKNNNAECINNILFITYKKLVKNKFIGKYLYKISKIYRLLYPTDERTICISSILIAMKSLIISVIIASLCIFTGKMHLYGYIILGCMLYVINSCVINSFFDKYEIKLLNQFIGYLGEVRHYFHLNGILEDAIYDSIEDCEKEISLHASLIYDILIEDEEDKLYLYKDISPNRYFMIFLSLCELVMKYGDTLKDDRSLFLDNLSELRDEVQLYVLKQQKIKFVFSGLTAICLIPPFTLKIIEKWGESNIPSLVNFYDGRYGLIVSILICIISVGTYVCISSLKNSYNYIESEHWFLNKLTSYKIINQKINSYIFNHPLAMNKIYRNIKRAGLNISIKNYLMKKILSIIGGLITSFLIMIYFIVLPGNKIEWYGILGLLCGVFIVGFLCGKIQDIYLIIRTIFIKSSMEDEVFAFHSIVIMLMHIKRMDVETMLEWLEGFSSIFKETLLNCINMYTYDEERALENLQKSEDFPLFVRLVEKFKSCDNVGIEKAFEEIYSQRKYYSEIRKQDNEISIANKGAIGRVIAFIPMIITIGLYLIVPFVLESLSELVGYTEYM